MVYAWEVARKTNTAESYEAYIEYPGAFEAEKKIATAKLTQFDALSWKDAIVTGTLDSYVAYYNSPRMVKGHMKDAEARLLSFDDKAWAQIADSRDKAVYQAYIDDTYNPCAAHKPLAQGLIDMLDANEIILTQDFDTAFAKYSYAESVGAAFTAEDNTMYELAKYRHQVNEDCRAFAEEPTVEKGMELLAKYPKKGLDDQVADQLARCVGDNLNASNVSLISKFNSYAGKETKEYLKERKKEVK